MFFLILFLLGLLIIASAFQYTGEQISATILNDREIQVSKSVSQTSIDLIEPTAIPEVIIEPEPIIIEEALPIEVASIPIVALYDIAALQSKVCAVFGAECSNALIIAQHESSYNPSVISVTNDYGLFQLNCTWQGHRVGGNCNQFLDVDLNIQIAYQIWSEQGWNPWYTKVYL